MQLAWGVKGRMWMHGWIHRAKQSKSITKATNLKKKPGDSSVDKSLVLTVEELLRQSKYIHRTSNLESDLRIMVSGRFSPRQNQVI
jgi:hypothetical protein